MKQKPLFTYLLILTIICGIFITCIKLSGERGMMFAQGYMLTPALAALIVRGFFYDKKFSDANLRFGKLKDYFRFWVISLAITGFSYLLFTLLGSVTWDFSGKTFLDNLSLQFASVGQDITDTLPSGFTPEIMLWLFFFGGLTLFNIMPGMITGFGEEFGHRGFMFPLLYKIKPWIGFVIGGLIWFAWHMPLALIMPQSIPFSTWEMVLNLLILGIGSLCTFIFLAFVYIKSRSVFVASFAHIVLNNSATSFSYLVTINDQLKANLGLSLTMVIVVIILYLNKDWGIFREFFSEIYPEPSA